MRSFTVNVLKQRARAAADMEDTQFISDNELIRVISTEYTALYDLLVQKFKHYNTKSTPYTFSLVDGQDTYDLPSDFYKMVGVDWDIGSGDYISLKSIPFTERNKYSLEELRYCILQDKILFKNDAQKSGTVRLWYIPQANALSGMFKDVTFDHTTDTLTKTDHGLVDDDYVMITAVTMPSGLIPGDIAGSSTRGRYFVINATANTFQLATFAGGPPVSFTSNGSGVRVHWFGDGHFIDGVSGWEDMIVLSAAIYMKNKEDTDAQALVYAREAIRARIETAAQNRDVGSPGRVSDVRGEEDYIGYFYSRYTS